MSANRYLHEYQPITEAEARAARKEQIATQLYEIEHRKEQIKECEDYIAHLKAKPLDTTINVQITLRPGDEGYDAAPIRFDPVRYQGDLKWGNTTS